MKQSAGNSIFPSCDTMVVLGTHTRSGATMLAKNSDRPARECQPLFQAPRRRNSAGASVHCQYLEIPETAETFAVIGSRPFWLWGFEHGINEHEVAIGNEAVLTREALPATGLLGMDLVRLGLERSRTAREAAAVIGALIERHGQGGSGAFDSDFRYSGGFIIADHAEAIVLESSGRQWVARRASDRGCISNRLTTGRYDFGSATVEHYARERGWWNGAEPFNFAAAYASDLRPDPLLARGRLERSSELIARNGRRTLRELMAVLRDHHGTGDMPPAADDGAVDRARDPSLCMHGAAATTASMIAELPAPKGDTIATMWASMAAPCTGIFFPLYVEAPFPPVLAAGSESPSVDSPWWRMKRIQDLVAAAPERGAPLVWEHFRPLEAAMLERAAEVGHRARKLDRADRATLLAGFMAHNVVRVLNTQAKLEAELLKLSSRL
jgi:secernin